ncbi:ribulose-phosphate 3-epimerase [Roseibium sp. TrichSKD4]|nr:ribulose-phosphate 3-epimerase [Roseibium sp. TrichSKD4]
MVLSALTVLPLPCGVTAPRRQTRLVSANTPGVQTIQGWVDVL